MGYVSGTGVGPPGVKRSKLAIKVKKLQQIEYMEGSPGVFQRCTRTVLFDMGTESGFYNYNYASLV
jgi:hypothetical protein